MWNGSRMDVDQLNRCVKHYHFLSPHLRTEGFSTGHQKTECCFTQLSPDKTQHSDSDIPTTSHPNRSPFSRFFASWRASCESPGATDRIEEAEKNLKGKGIERNQIVSEVEIQNYLNNETGKDRLYKMFTRDHMGNASPEAAFIYQVCLQSAGVTFLAMSFLSGRQAKAEFIDRNRATVFKTRFQAFRRLHDQIFMYSMKEGMKWAFRVMFFSASFMGISQSIAVYRNKSSVWEYTLASGVTIGLLKCSQGLRIFTVSTGFGLIAGTFMGLVVNGAMRALNETQEQRHYWEIHRQLEMEKYYESKGKVEVLSNL